MSQTPLTVTSDSSCCADHPPHDVSTGRGLLIFEIVILLAALVMSFMGNRFPQVGYLAVSFISIVLEAMPFVLFGALVGGFIEVFVPQDWVGRYLPHNRLWAVIPAGLLGIFFPVCECAVIPVIRRLLHKGVPLAACMTYLLAGPIVNPIVAASTYVAYLGVWQVVAIRLICGYLVALTIGLIIGRLFNQQQALRETQLHHSELQHDHRPNPTSNVLLRIRQAVENSVQDVVEIGRFLVLGAFIAAAVQTFIPQRELLRFAETPLLAIVTMMLLAVVLNLCSEADAFVAASFRSILPPSAQMAFMVLGPMMDIKLVFMYMGIFRKRMVVTCFSILLVMVLGLMLLLQYLLQRYPQLWP
ncbi:MAG: hypothetical protein HJJLKODD_02979 [Phycisphaerae bacterium]|nr:hypothetical protein [Phycisphaerae bacterium]